MRIVWLASARNDLNSIVDYHTTAASKEVATRLVKHIAHSATALVDNPHLGKPSESVNGIHELHVPRLPYLLPYRVNDDRVEILRVFHEAQDRPSTWQV